MRQSELDDYQHGDEYPWRNEQLLRELYIDKKKSTVEIADRFGCDTTTILNWMGRFEIPTRTAYKDIPPAFKTNRRGYERWTTSVDGTGHNVAVHRLLAVAEYGFDAVSDMDVHHGNGGGHLPPCEIPWANWPGNLELVSNSAHISYHKRGEKSPKAKLTAEDVREIRSRAEDESRSDLASEYGVHHDTISSVVLRKTWGHID